MALPRPVVLGNWKMNGLRADGVALAAAVAARHPRPTGTLGVFPPATILAAVAERLAGTGILVGGQDCHAKPAGAFTGCIAAPMLVDAGARAVILGHSERRHGLGETDAMVRDKAAAAIAAGLVAVVCVGETEEEWLAQQTLCRLEAQVRGSLPAGAPPDRLVVAYEPVWAIGTGRTPTIAEIGAVHAELRQMLRDSVAGGEAVPLLYGGSVKAANARAILSQDGVDGALVGGASLDAAEFVAIYEAGGGS
jgi:triosephosphate isomerase